MQSQHANIGSYQYPNDKVNEQCLYDNTTSKLEYKNS